MRNSGFGAFFHPPTILTDESKIEQDPITFVEGRKKPESDRYDYEIIENPVKRQIICNYTSIDDFQVFVTDDGFVGVNTALKKTAFEFLNVFFATMNTKFRKAQYISPDDVTLFFWEDTKNDFLEINITQTRSLRNLFHLKRDREETFPDWEKWPKQQIGKLLIKNLLDTAYRFYRNEQFKTDLELIGETSGMMLDLRLSASFLSSWLIIESILMKIGYDMMKSKSINLKNPKDWSSHYLIEEFFKQKKATEENKECLMNLKELRNDIVHDKKRDIIFEQAWNCLNIAIYMMYNQLNQANPFEDVAYKKIEYEKL